MKAGWIAGLMIAAVLLAAGGCERQPSGPPTVRREVPVAGPTSEAMVREARERLLAELDAIPELGTGLVYVAPDGEVWTRYESNLMIRELLPGDGPSPRLGQTVSIAYIGTIPSTGKRFDSRGKNNPLSFKLGSRDIVKGLSMALSTMRVGGRRRIFLPPDLAYGTGGDPQREIGPDQALIFEVELLAVTGEVVEFTLEDLPKVEPAGPQTPGAPPGTRGSL